MTPITRISADDAPAICSAPVSRAVQPEVAMTDSVQSNVRQTRPSIARWLAVALIVVVVDQITKIGFDNLLAYGQRLHVLPFFDFTLLYNRGAAFSFLAGAGGWQRWFFTVLGIPAVPVLVWLISRHRDQRLFCAALALILGGAVGNVIDRVLYGHVVDFLLFYWGDWYFPAFNIADAAITVGAVLMIYDEVWRVRKTRPEATNR